NFLDRWIHGPTIKRYVKPNRKYKLKISMYQRGVGLYKQSCEDDPNASVWSCGSVIRFFGLGRREKHYFSKDLEIPFQSAKDYDGRTWYARSWFANAGDNFMTWIGRAFE